MPVSFTYPGISDAESVAVNTSHGIEPGTATVVTNISNVSSLQAGTLVFSYGGNTIAWPRCTVAEHSIDYSSGNKITLTIYDRRWRWRYGDISGWWNRRKGDSTDLQTGYTKTPKELAALLLAEMGETGYDITLMPNDARPEVQWEREPPAVQLQKLCDDLGCRIILRHNNTVAIVPVGSGDLLPTMPTRLITPSTSLTNIYKPDGISVYSAPYQIDSRFTMEARAEASDGTLTTLAACSYLPDDGYFAVDMGNVTTEANAALARRSVYRIYEITGVVRADSFPHTTLADMEFEDQQLLLHPTKDKRIPARCYGNYCNEEAVNGLSFTGYWEDDIQIDPVRRLVTFPRPCYRISGGVVAAATMYLQTTVTMRSDTTHGYYRRAYDYALPGAPLSTDYAPLVRSEIKWTRRDTFTGSTTFSSATTSDTTTDAQLLEIAEAEVRKYTPLLGGQGVYNGIQPFELDGYRDRITWSWSTRQAPQTVISAGGDINEYVPGEEARRKNMALDRMLRRATQEELAVRVRE